MTSGGNYGSNSSSTTDGKQRHAKRSGAAGNTAGAGDRLCKQRVCAASIARGHTQNATGAINRQASRATIRNRADVGRQPQWQWWALRASPGRTDGAATGEEFSFAYSTAAHATE